MSITWRLNALISALLVLTLACFLATLILQAGPRVRAEQEGVMRFARDFVEMSAKAIRQSSDPSSDLARSIERLRKLRHVRINLAPPDRPVEKIDRTNTSSRKAHEAWWKPESLRAGFSSPDPITVPVAVGGILLGTVIISPGPQDEMSEILEAISGGVISGLLLTLFALGLSSWFVSRLLQPISALGTALHQMEEGDYNIGLLIEGAPEISAISTRVNTLARRLREKKAENQRLSERLVRVQDDERRDIARELHDELGPYLFAVRAGGTSLKGEAEKTNPDLSRLARLTGDMLEQIEEIQTTNRRVLRKLNPIGLSEIGLAATLESMAAHWREEYPDVALDLDLSPDINGLDETTTLTVYRVVQEGLTNVFRHADAQNITVLVHTQTSGEVSVDVRDDGQGLGENIRPGFGLSSMRQRVEALGGTMTLTSRQERGSVLTIMLPWAPHQSMTD
jgi:two-component system, NarL family, sensor histidine kinase UhpB